MPGLTQPKIGILINNLEGGGAEIMSLRLMKMLMEEGSEVFFFAMDRDFETPLPGDEETRQRLLARICLLSRSRANRSTILKALSAPFLYFKLIRRIRRHRIDTMISFMERANIMNLLLPFLKRRIISVRIHIGRDLERKSFLKRFMIKALYPLILHRADIINFNALESALSFQNAFRVEQDRISVIYNFCDAEALRKKSRQPVAWDYGNLFQGPVVVSSGRLVVQKGHVHLIRAFAEVCKTDRDAMLLIIGEGPLRHRLNRLARTLGIGDRVYIAGYQKNLMACMKEASLFVLSSLAEGFPNVLLEALAIGLPVISTDCPSGPRELLAPGTDPIHKTNDVHYATYGVLTPPVSGFVSDDRMPLSHAENKLAEAITALLGNPALCSQYRESACSRAAMYSESEMKPRWLALFRDGKIL